MNYSSGNNEVDVLIAHPYKHHAFQLAAGCISENWKTVAIFPLYKKGIGGLLPYVPGQIGKKASGYSVDGLSDHVKTVPFSLQLIKLLSFVGEPEEVEIPFDLYVSKLIREGKLKPRVFVSLQDYMPLSTMAAKCSGAKIWNDQILNLSTEASCRISAHYLDLELIPPKHDETVNDIVLAMADYVTAPSEYTIAGLSNRLNPSANLKSIPYGVGENFSVPRETKTNEITILARSNTIRKGGHLLAQALRDRFLDIKDELGNSKLNIHILGELEDAVKKMFDEFELDSTVVNLTHGTVAHSEVPKILSRADLFFMPTLSESMSLAAIEAMQASLPLVITDYAGVDCFQHNEMGVRIEDATCDAVVNSLLFALRNREKWDSWGKASREAANDLSWNVYKNKINKFCESIMADILRGGGCTL